MRPSPATGDEHVISGLRLKRQVDQSWIVSDLSGRHVATIHPNGTLAREKPPARSSASASLAAGLVRQCETWRDCPGVSNPVTDPLGALGASMLLSGLATLANRRVRRKLEANTKTPEEIERATRAFRSEVSRGHYHGVYCERLWDLQRRLNRAWRDPDMDRRKRALFEIFDALDARFETVHPGVPNAVVAELRALRIDAIARARQTVALFVRARLPQDSDAAYSRRELRVLNRSRKSQEPFEPYRAPEGP